MTNNEFINLLTLNTNQTSHIRTYQGTWHTGASHVPTSITTKIGKIVALLQEKINQGLLCRKEDESVLIYNFQLSSSIEHKSICTLDMVIKPFKELKNTHQNIGEPLQLVVDGTTGEIWNLSKGLVEMGLINESEIEEEWEKPYTYGNYNDYQALFCFVTVTNLPSLSKSKSLFKDKNNLQMQQHVAFDSMIEARQYLKNLENEKGLVSHILELSIAKENYLQLLETTAICPLPKKLAPGDGYANGKLLPDIKASNQENLEKKNLLSNNSFFTSLKSASSLEKSHNIISLQDEKLLDKKTQQKRNAIEDMGSADASDIPLFVKRQKAIL